MLNLKKKKLINMCVSYVGGKSKIAPQLIIPNIPTDIETYVEPFSGQFWTFFKMNLDNYPNLKTVVYNDFNPLNYNMYQCLKNHQELLEECEKFVVQEKNVYPTNSICNEQFIKFQNEIFAENFKVESYDYVVAAKYIYVLTQVFSGSNPAKSKFIDLKGKYHSKFTSFKNKLKKLEWQKMFERITFVENKDFQEIIEKYDSPTTYFYVDPPYYIVGEGNYYSNHDFCRQDHERLAKVLHQVESKFSLSYYDFPLLHEWFPEDKYRWERKSFAKAAAAKKNTKQTIGEELLIMNY
jgi:DNA adenine methylase